MSGDDGLPSFVPTVTGTKEDVQMIVKTVSEHNSFLIRLDERSKTFVTREYLEQKLTSQLWKIIAAFTGIMGTCVSVCYFIAKNVTPG